MIARIGLACFFLGLPLVAAAQVPIGSGLAQAEPTSETRKPDSPPATQPATAGTDRTPPEQLSEAERIARLRRAITAGETEIQELSTKLKEPTSEYAQAEEAFKQIDDNFELTKRTVERLRDEGAAEEAIQKAVQDSAAIERRWRLAKDRFDLAIQERRAIQDKLGALEQKLKQDRADLDKLAPALPAKPAEAPQPSDTHPTKPNGQPPAPPPAAPTEPSKSEVINGSESPPVQPAQPQAQEPAGPLTTTPSTATTTPPAATQPTATPPQSAPTGQPGETGPLGASVPAEQQAAPAQPPVKPPSERLVKAQEAASTKEVAALEAEAQAQAIESRIKALNENIEAGRKLLSTARQRRDNAQESKQDYNEEMQARWAEGATWTDIRELRQKVAEADERIVAAQLEVRERTDRLDALQSELSSLQSELIVAMQEAEASRALADQAKQALDAIQNPFAPENIVQWFIDHGPKMAFIVLGMIILLGLARILESRLVPIIARHSRSAAGTVEERENRAKTLLSVFHNTLRIVVVIGGAMMLLAEIGLNMLPLITAAGIVGLAVAFGAQNLIRDYFYGFIILLENQYTVNDVVRIGGIAGLVERITLRTTILRDLEGTVHFIPHGEIKSVSNLTHGWSRALFDIGVAYKEKPDEVMKVLVDLGREIRRDPEYSALILDDPEMLGVNEFGDSAVVIRFFIKTRPLKQWMVKREMLRRIKNKFDELGIEIPFPHRTVFHHYEANGEAGDGAGPIEGRELPQWEEGPYAKR